MTPLRMDIRTYKHNLTLRLSRGHTIIVPHAKAFSNKISKHPLCHTRNATPTFSPPLSPYISPPLMHILTAQDCLSPFLDEIMERPLAERVSRTNTSITVNWTAPTLEPSCTNVFFPPLMYMVRARLDMRVVDGYPQVSTMYMGLL